MCLSSAHTQTIATRSTGRPTGRLSHQADGQLGVTSQPGGKAASSSATNATGCSVIVIATMQRSGSTEFASRLARDTGFTNLNEVFNEGSHGGFQSPAAQALLTPREFARRRNDPVRTLQRCLEAQCGNRSASDRRPCGVLLKLFPSHLGRNVSSTVLRMQGACTVVLERNSAGRVCSLQTALRGGDWQTKPVDKGRVHSTNCSTAYLNKTALWRGQVRAHRLWYTHVRALLREHLLPSVELTFENVTQRTRRSVEAVRELAGIAAAGPLVSNEQRSLTSDRATGRADASHAMDMRLGPSTLAIMAIARDECQSYPSWLAHYRAQGVTTFHIIDNNSTDWTRRGCLNVLRAPDIIIHSWPYTARDLATAKAEGRYSCPSNNHTGVEPATCGSIQVAAYNMVLPHVAAEWIMPVDLDEYAFGVRQTLASFLASSLPSVLQVCIPWLIFGSGNRTVQPACIARDLVRRAKDFETNGKCVQRTRYTRRIEVHRSVMHGETYNQRREGCVCPNGAQCRTKPPPSLACAGKMARLETSSRSTGLASYEAVRLHHYKAQSQEFIERKMSNRESTMFESVFNRQSAGFWLNRDRPMYNEVVDTALAERAACPHNYV